jgi:superfamily II DNA or RNA helicase/phage anti-repressor protein
MQTKLESGHEYEVYVKNIIKDKYKNIWLWKELSKEVLLEIGCIKNINDCCDDIGCDIVCQLYDDTYIFIQCKNYSTTGIDNTINISDLSGFYNFIAETGYNGIVYYSGKLSSQILYRKKRINYINLPHVKNNKILDFKPYEYQIEAYNKLKNNNRAILSMPCGTGKTFVSFLLSLDYKNIIILTPLISTTEQILSHYKNYYNEYTNIDYVLVNCKATRKIDNLKGKNIIASTYDSTNIILPILNTLEKVLIIIDEFHNISNNMITEDNDMNKILKTTHDVLFMSATPKEHIIFGTCKYELSWDTAISNKYICDYNFYYPDNSKIITKIEEMKFDTTIIEKTILINKAYYLLESIKESNIRKCIVYLKTIKEAAEFVKILLTLNIYFNHNIKVYNINFHTGKNVRNKYLSKFQYDNSCINIMCNVHILDEGIDIPNCDSIYLTHPNNNPTNIIQRISRANRLDSTNKDKIAKIFLWTKDKTKLDNIISNISTVIKVKYAFDNCKIINNITSINDNIKLPYNTQTLKTKLIEQYKNTVIDINIDFINFIETFFNYDQTIDLTNVAKWLNVRKENLKKLLKTHFILGTDYSEKKIKQLGQGIGSNNIKHVLLTYECAKSLCMLSKSEKSYMIRKYYIDIEKLLIINIKIIL